MRAVSLDRLIAVWNSLLQPTFPIALGRPSEMITALGVLVDALIRAVVIGGPELFVVVAWEITSLGPGHSAVAASLPVEALSIFSLSLSVSDTTGAVVVAFCLHL